MNAAYYLDKGIQSLLKKYGYNGAIAEISKVIGVALAGEVVNLIMKGLATKAVAALGGKIGALAGPIGVAVGFLLGTA